MNRTDLILAAIDEAVTDVFAHHLLVVMARYADEETGAVLLKREELEARSGIEIKTVDVKLAYLQDAGLIQKFGYKPPSGGYPFNGYSLLLTVTHGMGTNTTGETGRNSSGGNVVSIGEKRKTSPHEIHTSFADSLSLSRGDSLVRESPTPRARGAVVSAAMYDAGDRIWEAMAPTPQQRTRDAKRIAYALRDLALPPGDLERYVEALVEWYAHPRRQESGGKFAKAAHVLIADPEALRDALERNNDPSARSASRETPEPAGGAPTAPVRVDAEEARWASEMFGQPPGVHPIGTDRQPGARRQWGWLESWFSYHPDDRDLHWDEARQGPMPGRPNCRVWMDLLQRYLELNPSVDDGGLRHG